MMLASWGWWGRTGAVTPPATAKMELCAGVFFFKTMAYVCGKDRSL